MRHLSFQIPHNNKLNDRCDRVNAFLKISFDNFMICLCHFFLIQVGIIFLKSYSNSFIEIICFHGTFVVRDDILLSSKTIFFCFKTSPCNVYNYNIIIITISFAEDFTSLSLISKIKVPHSYAF